MNPEPDEALTHRSVDARDGRDCVAPAAPSSPRRRSRYVPAVLDAIIPGVGHLVAGRRRRALLFLSPLLVALAAGVWIGLTTSGPRLAASLLSSEVIWGLIAAQGLFLVWRLLAVGSSLFDPALPKPGRRDAIPIAILLVVMIAPQAYAGYATEVAREAADEIFVEPSPVAVLPSAEPEPDPSNLATAAPSPSSSPSLSPSPSAAVAPRINGLIIGVDAGVGRNTYLTDTMIVVSLDPTTQTVSMVSIPRDMVDVPLADGRSFRGKINGLVSYARHHPKQFPGSDGTGFDVLMGALGTLLEVPITYYATVNLGGFVKVVDTLGGVDVDGREGLLRSHVRRGYGFNNGFSITAGRHHLNGNQALAFARVRKASGESDFTRAARQQEVLSGHPRVDRPRRLPQRPGRAAQGHRQDGHDERAPQDPAGPRRHGQPGRTRADLPGGHHPSAGRLGQRQPRLDPDPGREGHPQAGRQAVPDRRVACRTTSTPSRPRPGSVKGSGVGSCAPKPTPKPTAKPTPEADAEAHRQAERHARGHAEPDARADADADPPDARPRPRRRRSCLVRSGEATDLAPAGKMGT